MKISIRNTKDFGNGWQCQVICEDGNVDVRTDRSGSGLWFDDKQVVGYHQYYAKTKSAFVSKVRRWFKDIC